MKKNTKIIRLTENDLERMVRRIIKEDVDLDNGLLQKIKSLNPMKSKSKSGRIKYYNNNVELVAIKDKNVLMISGYYFLSDLGWQPTTWSISRPLDQEMLESFKALWNQHMPPVEIVRIFDHKPEQLKGALITKPDFDKTSDDFGQIFGEDYMEDMPKPGIGQKLKQGLRDLSGIGNKNDNATLKQIHALIAKGAVDNVRRQPNGITAWVNNKALILDIEMPEIIYAGRNLEVANLESKVLDLYSELLDFI